MPQYRLCTVCHGGWCVPGEVKCAGCSGATRGPRPGKTKKTDPADQLRQAGIDPAEAAALLGAAPIPKIDVNERTVP